MMVLLIDLYLFIPLSVTQIIFQGHSFIKQFLLKSICPYLIKSKLCRIVKCMKYIMNSTTIFDYYVWSREIIDMLPDVMKILMLTFLCTVVKGGLSNCAWL